MNATATVRPVRGRRPLVLVLIAHGVSVAGNVATFVAIPWYVLQTTGSPARTGIAAGVAVVPAVLSSVFGGVVLDRLGLRRASVLADLASGASVAVIPALAAVGALSYPLLLVLVFLGALLDAPGQTAKIALIPDLSEAAGTPIERSTSALDAVERLAKMLGAPVAGLLIGLIGAQNVLLVDAATFAVSAALVAVSGARGQPHDAAGVGYLAGLREGLAFLWHDRLLRAIVAMVTVTNLLDLAFSSLVVPVYADRVLGGARDLGLLLGAFSGGAALGALTFGAVGHRLPRWPTYTLAFLLVGAPRYLVFALEPGLAVLLAVNAASGFLAGAINPILGSVQFARIPPPLRARVIGAISAGVLATSPLGPVLGGALIPAVGLTATLLLLGGAYLAAASAPVVAPVWRQLDRPAAVG